MICFRKELGSDLKKHTNEIEQARKIRLAEVEEEQLL